MSGVLARQQAALTPEQVAELVTERLGEDAVVGTRTEYGTFTLEVPNESFAEVAGVCRDERVLAYDLFDCLFGIDAREEGFDVVAILYSTSTGNRVCLRTRCPGGREAPTCPTLTGLYRGADWHERETWDMFGIEFEGHPGLEPRILTVENFEGWPLRKDFHLASRVVKPWPGVKEPAELDEDGNVIERVPRIGDAPGPYELDKAMAEQAKLANPAPDTPAETELASEEKPEPKAKGEDDKPEAGIDQATYDALIAEGKSERIARSKAKAAFVKKQRQQAADDASDKVAETESGQAVAADAERAETASDSGKVLSGDVEQQAEEAEAQATEVSKEAAAQAEYEQAEAAAEHVEAGEVTDEDAESAADKAEAKRRAAAEARAKKAEERAKAAEQGDDAAEGDAPDEGGASGEDDA